MCAPAVDVLVFKNPPNLWTLVSKFKIGFLRLANYWLDSALQDPAQGCAGGGGFRFFPAERSQKVRVFLSFRKLLGQAPGPVEEGG